MNKTTYHKPLLFDFILFLVIIAVVWAGHRVIIGVFPGNNLFPIIIRSVASIGLMIFSYYVNYRFLRRNLLNQDILQFKFHLIKQYSGGIILGCLLIATIWFIFYLIYPFEIIKSPDSTINAGIDIISYSLGNTLEELLFRVFLLIASVRLFEKIGGILVVSLLFGLFHLQGTGPTQEGLIIVITTSTMSLLFISVIYYTNSIWTAVTLHITGNLLLHTLGFDGTNNGLFQVRFSTSNMDGYSISLLVIYQIVVVTFALLIFINGRKRI